MKVYCLIQWLQVKNIFPTPVFFIPNIIRHRQECPELQGEELILYLNLDDWDGKADV
jgi:hypothetical protein